MRNIVLTLQSGDELSVRSFSVLEAMSACFHADVLARGREDVDLEAITGQPAALTLHTGAGSRTWAGVCARIVQTQVEPEGLSTYTVRVVPALWLLTHRRNHRVFQHLSAPEIARKILVEWQIDPLLHVDVKAHPKLEYRVQYGESDYDFVRRQLVEAGISFYFAEDERGETRLVLSDAPQSSKPRSPAIPFVRDSSGAEKHDHVTGVALSSEVLPGRSTVRDFDFRRPRYALTGSHAVDKSPEGLLEEYAYLPGHSHAESPGQDGAPVGDRDGTYRHTDKAAQGHASRRVEALRGAAGKVQFHTSVKDLAPGTVFSMSGHPHPALGAGKNLLVTQSWISGDEGGETNAGGDAVSAEHPYRPVITGHPDDPGPRGPDQDPFKPVLGSTKPRIQGVQSALVTGPAGDEIFTDEHGRVRVQFPWDREGKFDDKSSCWVRVSHAAAGAGFGNVSVPRVGQEVLVSFLDGDPDHPVVVGRMFNAAAPAPYALPEHKTRTSWVGQSSPGGAGANEITFDDKAEGELVYIQAQKDLHKIVKQNELEHTQGHRHISVDGDLVLSAKGRVIIHAGDHIVVKGSPHVKINPAEQPAATDQPKALAVQAHAAKKKKPAGANTNTNAALGQMNPGAMPVSAQTAAARKKLAEKYQGMAEKLGAKHHVPPALILGLMSRESGFGTLLDASGRGDHGHGFGILQVDDRSHVAVGGPYSYEHADQAMGIFDSGLSQVRAEHPGWTQDQQLAGAVAAYNAGPGNIHTEPTSPSSWAAMDGGTTGNDYSRDTWAQSQWFANNLKW